MKEKNVNNLVSVIENGNYQKIENLLPLLDKIDSCTAQYNISASFIKHRDICLKLIENEKNDGKWGFFSGSIPRLLAERALNSR